VDGVSFILSMNGAMVRMVCSAWAERALAGGKEAPLGRPAAVPSPGSGRPERQLLPAGNRRLGRIAGPLRTTGSAQRGRGRSALTGSSLAAGVLAALLAVIATGDATTGPRSSVPSPADPAAGGLGGPDRRHARRAGPASPRAVSPGATAAFTVAGEYATTICHRPGPPVGHDRNTLWWDINRRGGRFTIPDHDLVTPNGPSSPALGQPACKDADAVGTDGAGYVGIAAPAAGRIAHSNVTEEQFAAVIEIRAQPGADVSFNVAANLLEPGLNAVVDYITSSCFEQPELGEAITIRTAIGSFLYEGFSDILVEPEQKLRAGQLLGHASTRLVHDCEVAGRRRPAPRLRAPRGGDGPSLRRRPLRRRCRRLPSTTGTDLPWKADPGLGRRRPPRQHLHASGSPLIEDAQTISRMSGYGRTPTLT
jgi:hypothetical protein